MILRGVVGHQVDDDPQAVRMRLRDQCLALVQGAEHRVDVAVVGDVVARIGLRRGIERAQPDRVDTQLRQVRQLRPNAVQIADAVAVGIGKAPRIDLVDHR